MAQTTVNEQSNTAREVKISIRAHKNQRDLIDSAAEHLGKTRSDFMLESACREAESVLTDQRVFVLDDKQWKTFIKALDAPPKPRPRLEKLMREKTLSES